MRYVSYARLAIAICFVMTLWAGLSLRAVSAWFSLIPAAAFFGLVLYHGRLRRAQDRARRAAAFYERGLSRLENRWQGNGNPGTEYRQEDHLYAADLDILGNASLFELLCTARTRAGEETLARRITCIPLHFRLPERAEGRYFSGCTASSATSSFLKATPCATAMRC
jgi:hypothetical protein